MKPSLILLVLKIICVFVISYVSGWCVRPKRISEDRYLDWYYTSVTGSCALIISVIWATICGIPGKYGLLLPVVLAVLKLYLLKGDRPEFRRETAAGILLTGMLGSAEYILPFLVDGTSGFYSRGGGDHSSYLTLSEWFVNHGYWINISDYSAMQVTNENWMVNRFLSMVNRFMSNHREVWMTTPGPVANQYIASPYMAILPGRIEETYSAAVAFYVTMTGMSCGVLFSEILKKSGSEAMKVSCFVLLSPMLLYIATSQAVPFLYGLCLMNVMLSGIVRNIRENDWELKNSVHFLILGGGLFLIYPHLYVLGSALVFLLLVSLSEKIFSVEKIKFFLWSVLITFGITNIFLQISLPLVYLSSSMNMGGAASYTMEQILLTWTGLVDFGYWVSDRDIVLTPNLSRLSSYVLVPALLILSGLSLVKAGGRRILGAVLLLVSILLLSLYYNARGMSYQAVRFTEIGNGYLLAAAGFGLLRLLEFRIRAVKYGGYVLMTVLVVNFLNMRKLTSKEVRRPEKNTNTEYRTGLDFETVDELKKYQSGYPRPEGLVYYLGNGFGVELAGISILFRELRYLAGFGFDYEILTDIDSNQTKISLWDRKLLKNSILVKLSREDFILEDLREKAKKKYDYENSKYRIMKTENSDCMSLVGTYWNSSEVYDLSGRYRYFRYLKDREGAAVIWSSREEKAEVKITAHGDSEKGELMISGDLEAGKYPLAKWEHKFSEKNTYTVTMNLKPGPNVILLRPYSADKSPVWLLLWKISVKNL